MLGRIASALTLSLAFAAAAPCTTACADPPPAAAYGQLPAVAAAAISPDGGKVVLAQNVGDTGVVRVLAVGGGEIALVRMGERQSLRSVAFADDDTIIYTISQTFTADEAAPDGVHLIVPGRLIEYYRAIAMSLSDRTPHMLLNNANNFLDADLSEVIAPIEGEPGTALMVGFIDPAFEDHSQAGAARRDVAVERIKTIVYRVDLATGRGRPAEDYNGENLAFLFDEHGRIVAHTEAIPSSNRWRLWSHAGRSRRVIVEEVSRTGAPPTLGLLGDGRAGYIETPDGADKAILRAIDLTNGAVANLLDGGRNDIGWGITDPWTHRLVGAGWVGDLPQQKFLDQTLAGAYAALKQRFPDNLVAIASWSRDKARLLVRIERASDGGGWYLFEPASGALARIALDYPALDGASMGQVLAITYPARDGTPVPAILTLPRGAEPKNLPLVVLVHGGPADRDSMAFDWWAQFLASRGYAVLQPNFRGSSGFGSAWENAGLKQWGRLMQSDVEDGAAALVRSGRVDPARICIVGASYGGFAALAGATLTPSRYACAVSINGVADPESFLDSRIRQYGSTSSTADYWRLSIGDPGDDRSAIRAISPVRNAAAASAPILLMHGQEDTTVSIEQSRQMKAALERAGKSVRYVELTGDDHYLSAPSTRIRMLEEVDAFLRTHLAARAQ